MDDKFKQIVDKFIKQLVPLILDDVMLSVRKELVGVKGSGVTKPFAPKPCPVCGALNKNRRFRFYCSEHKAQSGSK